MGASEPLKKHSSEVKLKKDINLFTGCCIIIGNIIGSGIFIACRGVIASTESPGMALIVWALSGILSLFGAYCYTELGALIPTSGGDYAYINESYGRFMAFLFTYTMVFLTIPCMNAVFGMTVAVYIAKLFFPDCNPESLGLLTQLIAALTITILCVVNMSDVKLVSKIQSVFTITKVAALLIIIVAGFYYYIRYVPISPGQLAAEWFSLEKFNYNGIAMAFYLGLFSYSGWNCLNFLIEEIKEPSENLPKAIFLSLPMITVIYMITNLAYYLVLSPQEIIDSEAVALKFSEKALSSVPWLTSLFISVSTLGALSGCMLGSSRVYYAAARDGNLPQCFALINVKTFTPVTCILLQTFVSLLMLLIKDLDTLVLYGTFSEVLFIGITISTVIYFRYSRPTAHRPIKVHIAFPIIFLIVCIFLILITFVQNPFESIMGIIFLLSGVPVYLVGVSWKNKPKKFVQFSDQLTRFCQVFLQSVKED